MKLRIACLLVLGLSTAALAGPKSGMTGSPNGAAASGNFDACQMPLKNGPSFGYMTVPCMGAHV